VYSYLQYGSSVAGALVIAVWLARSLRRVPPNTAATSAVPVLSTRDRWWATVLLAACAAVGAVERAARWWAYWGGTAKPWELIPSLCFGTGAGLVPGLLVYVLAVRLRRPSPAVAEPERVSAEQSPPAGR
jgi:hypothetical protein